MIIAKQQRVISTLESVLECFRLTVLTAYRIIFRIAVVVEPRWLIGGGYGAFIRTIIATPFLFLAAILYFLSAAWLEGEYWKSKQAVTLLLGLSIYGVFTFLCFAVVDLVYTVIETFNTFITAGTALL